MMHALDSLELCTSVRTRCEDIWLTSSTGQWGHVPFRTAGDWHCTCWRQAMKAASTHRQ